MLQNKTDLVRPGTGQGMQLTNARHAAYVAAARVMGAAVVSAAAVAVLVFAGVFPSWPGASTGHRTETLEQQSSGTTTPGSVPSTATPPSPSTTTDIEPPALPPSDPGAIRGTTARARTPARRSATQARNATASSNSTGAEQLSATSILPPSDAPAPVTPMTPNTNPAEHAPPGRVVQEGPQHSNDHVDAEARPAPYGRR
jgi:hypothetical protein